MDDNDLLILRELRKDARVSLVDINKRTGIPVSTVFDKVSKMEKKGIVRYAGLYGYEKLGHSLRVNFLFRLKKDTNASEFLSSNPRINNLFRVNSGYDYYIEAVFSNFSELDSFIEQLQKLAAKDMLVFHTLEELRRESFVI